MWSSHSTRLSTTVVLVVAPGGWWLNFRSILHEVMACAAVFFLFFFVHNKGMWGEILSICEASSIIQRDTIGTRIEDRHYLFVYFTLSICTLQRDGVGIYIGKIGNKASDKCSWYFIVIFSVCTYRRKGHTTTWNSGTLASNKLFRYLIVNFSVSHKCRCHSRSSRHCVVEIFFIIIIRSPVNYCSSFPGNRTCTGSKTLQLILTSSVSVISFY